MIQTRITSARTAPAILEKLAGEKPTGLRPEQPYSTQEQRPSSAVAHPQAPQFGALKWRNLFRRKPAPTPPQPPTADAKPAATKPVEIPVEFDRLAKVIANHDPAFVDELFTTYPNRVKNNLLILQDNGTMAGTPFRLMARKGENGKGLVWLDILGTAQAPLFQKMAATFTLTDFQKENPENSDIPYDVPVIDHDSIQFTIYCMRLEKGTTQEQWDAMTRKQRRKAPPPGDKLHKEELYMYAGDNFLITVHPEKRPSVDKTINLMSATGKAKTPAELMSFILNENINRYQNIMSTLHADMSGINQKASQKNIDQNALINDCLRVGQKIDEMHFNIQQQLGVLTRLSELNEFHDSELISPIKITNHTTRLEKLLQVLDHYQDVKEALDANIQAKVSNEMSWVMKKVASLGILAIPTTSMGALWGMNVAVPGAENPEMFKNLSGGAAILTGCLYLALKRFRWL